MSGGERYGQFRVGLLDVVLSVMHQLSRIVTCMHGGPGYMNSECIGYNYITVTLTKLCLKAMCIGLAITQERSIILQIYELISKKT